MKKEPSVLVEAAELRHRAEERLQGRERSPKSEADTQRFLHELQVHEIESEMQNAEQRRTQNELSTALERYTELYDLTPVGCLTLQPDGTIRQANLTAASLLRIERSRLVHRRLEQYVAAEARSAFNALLTRAFAAKASESGEVRLMVKDKPPLTVQFQACVVGDGEECHVVLTDLTEIKRVEAALRESEARFRGFMDNAPTIAWMKDEDGRYVYLSRTYERRFGVRLDDWRGKTDFEVWSRGTAEEFRKNDLAVLSGGQVVEVIEKSPNADGNCTWWWGFKFPLQDASGRRFVGGIGVDITDRMQSEEALRESEEKFRAIANHTANVEAWFGPDRRLRWINPSVQRVMGYSVEECLGMPGFPLPIIHPDDIPMVTREFDQIQQVVRGENSEFRFVCKDGTVRWGSVSWQPIFDSQGQPMGHRSSVRDVTERKQAEERLRESEDRYRSLVATSMDAVLLTAPDGRILAANEAACRLFGCSEQELIRVGRSGVVDKSDPRLAAALEERTRTGRFHGELTFVRKDGTKFPAEISSAIFSDAKGQQRTSMVIRDTTERRHAEEQLRYQATLLDQIHDTVTATDLGGRITYVNEAQARALKRSRAELIGQSVVAFGDAPARGATQQQIIAATRAKGSWRGEVVNRDSAGNELVVEVRTTVIRDTTGQPVGMCGVGTDITERKRAEERVRMFSQEIIAAREEERRRVSSVLHHDVGSLAVGIAAHLDAVEEDLRSGKPGEALKWMKRTRKLFDESVVRLKRLAVQLRPPDLDVLGLGAALRQHFAQVTERGAARIHFKATLGRRRVTGNTVTILFRVAQEALTNAIKHGHAKRVDVGLSASKGEVRLTVRDNGKGFDPSEQRARATSQMGLRVMQEMADAAGGALSVDSGRGKGTTLRASLPLVPVALGRADVTVRERAAARGKKTRPAGQGPRPRKGRGP